MRRNGFMWLVLLMLVSACGPTNFLSPAQPTIAPQALTLSASTFTPIVTFTPDASFTPTLTLTPTASVTPTIMSQPPLVSTDPTLISKDSPYPQACSFNWATKERPELSQMLGAALEEKGFKQVEVYASDYGENCISYKTRQVQYFAAMTTDIEITAHVPPGEHALNTHAANALIVLQNVWSDPTMTNALNGSITLDIISETGRIKIQGLYKVLIALLAQHPDAKNLFESCRSSVSREDIPLLTCERQD